MVITVEQVSAEIMKLRDIAGRLCYENRADMRRHYGLAAIANKCTEQSVTPSQYSQTFWNIVSRYSY